MERMCNCGQYISAVDPDSPAMQAGVRTGEMLLAINQLPVHDIVDYEYLTSEDALTLTLLNETGEQRSVPITKQPETPLGLGFATSLMSPVRACRNHCVFCFIDQMPKGVRSSLAFKDDDWRLSFIMGNYVTLTNIDDAEFARILARRVSPLYVSVHATDSAVRCRMMRNPSAGSVMERLQALSDAGLCFHAQIVLCPELNDGTVLKQTLADLISLMPACRSVAIVPVGLTKYRENLYPLRCFSEAEAAQVIQTVGAIQDDCTSEYGEPMIYLSDEWYVKAGAPLPAYSHYGDFPQIENGVGLLRLFEHDYLEALSCQRKRIRKRCVSVAGGAYAVPFCGALCQKLLPYRILVNPYAIRNDYFGDEIGVAGLVTGQDLTTQLAGKPLGETLFIPHAMLKEREDVFLDGMTLSEAQTILQLPVIPFYDGEDFINKIFGRKNHG